MTDERKPSSERHAGTGLPGVTPGQAPASFRIDTPRAWQRVDPSVPPTAADTASAGSGRGRVAAIGLALALASAGVLAMGSHADSQLSFELRGASAQGGVIEAERGEATVALSDGSSILAENGSKFSVDVVGRNAALTRLVVGKLHVRVSHHDDTSYRFLAGPYEVRVVGTEFDLTWEPDATGLALVMSKGEVHLNEPGGQVLTLKAGESLRLPGLSPAP